MFSCAGVVYELTPEAKSIHDNLAEYVNAERIELLKNTKYQTPAFIFSGEEPGSNILIIGGTHGNEPAGYEAALRLLKRFYQHPLKKGKIVLIPEANRVSVLNYERRVPVPQGVDIEKGNLNRCYPGDENGLPMQQMAAAIQNLAIENKVNVFIDLHEALNYHLDIEETAEQKGLGQTIIYTPNEPSTWLVMNMMDKINSEISELNQKFTALERPILNSAAWWAGNHLGIAAFTFETSRKNPIEMRIKHHLRLVDIVLETENVY